MSKQSTAHTRSGFVCSGDPSRYALSCSGEGWYKNFNGKPYCILHYPENKDIERFTAALRKKLAAKNLFFDYVYFPIEAQFKDMVFDQVVSFYNTHSPKASHLRTYSSKRILAFTAFRQVVTHGFKTLSLQRMPNSQLQSFTT